MRATRLWRDGYRLGGKQNSLLTELFLTCAISERARTGRQAARSADARGRLVTTFRPEERVPNRERGIGSTDDARRLRYVADPVTFRLSGIRIGSPKRWSRFNSLSCEPLLTGVRPDNLTVQAALASNCHIAALRPRGLAFNSFI